MKKSSWKLILIIVAGILAVVMLGVFGVQSSQNKAFSLEEQVNTADSDIKVQKKRRDLQRGILLETYILK